MQRGRLIGGLSLASGPVGAIEIALLMRNLPFIVARPGRFQRCSITVTIGSVFYAR